MPLNNRANLINMTSMTNMTNKININKTPIIINKSLDKGNRNKSNSLHNLNMTSMINKININKIHIIINKSHNKDNRSKSNSPLKLGNPRNNNNINSKIKSLMLMIYLLMQQGIKTWTLMTLSNPCFSAEKVVEGSLPKKICLNMNKCAKKFSNRKEKSLILPKRELCRLNRPSCFRVREKVNRHKKKATRIKNLIGNYKVKHLERF